MGQDGTIAPEYSDVVTRLREIGLVDEPELFAETVELFVTDAVAVVVQLKDAFASGNALALERAAHRLKGAALNLGVSSIAAPAKALEDEARRHGFAGAPAAITALEEEIRRVASFLRSEVSRATARA